MGDRMKEGHSPSERTTPTWANAAARAAHPAAAVPVPDVPPVPPPPVPDVPVKASLANREPVALGGAAQGVLAAVFAVLVGFDVWHPTGEQIGVLMALYTALITAATAWARSRAWAPATVAQVVEHRGGA